MARILAGTASALDTAVEDWRAGRQPAELLFGYNHLEAAGHDVDVEAIGMGFVVGDDPAQWHRALSELLTDPEGAAERGAAGRRYAERHWNNALFGQGVVEVVDSVLERA